MSEVESQEQRLARWAREQKSRDAAYYAGALHQSKQDARVFVRVVCGILLAAFGTAVAALGLAYGVTPH
jgi:hypothetical protein